MFYGYYYYQDYENENDIDYAFCSQKCYTELGFTDDAINIATCEPNYCEYCQNCGVKVVSGAECLPDNPCDFSGYQEVNSPKEIEDFINVQLRGIRLQDTFLCRMSR